MNIGLLALAIGAACAALSIPAEIQASQNPPPAAPEKKFDFAAPALREL